MTEEKSFEEILLESAFYTMACDGNIAVEEIAIVKEMSTELELFGSLDVEPILNKNIEQLNKFGDLLINRYLRQLKKVSFSDNQVKSILNVVIEVIYSDKEVEYNEIRFFRNIKANLKASDALVLDINKDATELLGEEIFVTDLSQISKSKNFLDSDSINFQPITFT